MNDHRSERVGLWKRADIRTLDALCKEGLRLNDLPTGGLLGAMESPKRFSSATMARQALHAHPIHQWMNRHMPRVLQLARADEGLGDIKLVQLLLRHLVIAWSSPDFSAAPRTDKRRAAAYRAIERVERQMDEGVIALDQCKDEALRELLAQAKHDLASAHQKPPKHPALRGLAFGLHRHFRIADATLLTEIASAAGIECDIRTAQRYVKEATTT